MQQITITVDLTAENLEILKQLCGETQRPVKTKKESAKSAAELAPAPVPTEPTEKPIELSDVRALALSLSKAGKQDALKSAFAKFGGKKLSDIKPENYGELMSELSAEVTDNA